MKHVEATADTTRGELGPPGPNAHAQWLYLEAVRRCASKTMPDACARGHRADTTGWIAPQLAGHLGVPAPRAAAAEAYFLNVRINGETSSGSKGERAAA